MKENVIERDAGIGSVTTAPRFVQKDNQPCLLLKPGPDITKEVIQEVIIW